MIMKILTIKADRAAKLKDLSYNERNFNSMPHSLVPKNLLNCLSISDFLLFDNFVKYNNK